MARLSRAESQAQTRQQLLDVATHLFLRDGYFATSIDRVADEAGYSKGAVYSNFRNKDELCLAVLDAVRGDQATQIAQALLGSDSPEGRVAAFELWAEKTLGDEGWSNLEIEFASQVRRNEPLRIEYARRAVEIRSMIAALIEGAAAELGIALPVPAADAATALLSLGIGLGLQRAVEHDLPVTAMTNLIRLLAGLPVD